VFGEETIVDAQGKPHSWRKELIGRLVAMQQPAGSWVNENSSRWYEGNPVLATSYARMALATAAK
jgi:squalene-hopene/tetraprenyl-beta-curcumene cyclase